jgi:hypothetical protein
MAKLAEPPQFDLFEPVAELPRQRGGIPRHVPTPESRLLVSELKAAGLNQEAIARKLGISRNTLAIYYFPALVACPPMGRRRHAPTAETRTIVRRAIRSGMGRAKVAKLIGISLPTLRLHYRDELQPSTGPREG